MIFPSKTVLTIGTFDLLHPGHLELLRECHKLANPGKVVVGLNKDSFVYRYKGYDPILSFEERRECLLACRYVDAVVPNLKDEDASACIELVRPDIIAVGSDWEHRDYMGQLGNRARMMIDFEHIEVIYVPRSDPPKISSSIIKQKILSEYAQDLRNAIFNN